MSTRLLRTSVLLGAAAILLGVSAVRADDPLLFISSFEAGEKGAIHACKLDLKTGKLSLVKRTGGVEHPFFLALSPDNRFLYSIHAKVFSGKENEEIAAFALSGRSGEMKLLNRQSAKGTAACSLNIDSTGKTLAVANYTSGSVASLPIKEDGSLGEAASFIQHKGSSVDPERQKEPHAHCILFSPDNQFALAADLGLDQILVYKHDPKTSKLTANEPPFAKSPAGAGPRHLTFDSGAKHVYVVNELSNSVTVFDYDAKTGKLGSSSTISTLPEGFKGTSYCADLRITPNGKFLYATNRGHDSIAVYRIGDDGRLKLIEIEPSHGKGPQNLAITPDGKYLVCANMPGNNVAVFTIDAKTGELKSAGETYEMPSPSCIRLVP